MSAKILLVEDEDDLRETLAYNLQREGYEVLQAADGEEGLRLFQAEPPDLLLLDLMLPRLSGVDLCAAVRRGSNVPIIMLTARAEEVDRVVGLEMGADDYVTKPFSMRELLARVRAALRRARMSPAGGEGSQLEYGPLRIHLDAREVSWEDRPVALARREFDLLAVLAGEPGIVFTRDRLLSAAWGDDFYGDDRTVDVHVRWIREKLSRAGAPPEIIETVRGVGYKFRSPAGTTDER